MKRIMVAGALMALTGCGQPGAVSANSADSVTTTAVGNVVATIPSPTPTPEIAPDAAANSVSVSGSDSNSVIITNTM